MKNGRIYVELSDELEKQLRFKTVEKFGGKKGDLKQAVEEAAKDGLPKKNSSTCIFVVPVTDF